MPAGRPRRRLVLPKISPGTSDQLLEIAQEVVGGRSNRRTQANKTRLHRVAEELRRLGVDLLDGLHAQQDAPSPHELERQLEKLQEAAQAQVTLIARLPPFMRGLLDTRYHAQRTWDPVTKRFEPIGIGSAPIEKTAAAILEAARQQLACWREGSVLGSVSPHEPGPMNSYQRIVHDPRAFIVDQITKLVIREQGTDAATAEEHRPVYAAVIGLWEWTTGLTDEGAHLRKYIRQNVKSALIQTEISSIAQAIVDEVTRYHDAPADFSSPAIKRDHNLRVEELRARTDQLREAQVLLLQSTSQRKRKTPSN